MAKKRAEASASEKLAWRILAVLLVGAFMALLDVTIVNVALPSIQMGLHTGSSTLEWVVSGYVLALGLVLIPSGRIGDNIGHRWTFLTGLAVFTLASLACGLSRSSHEIIISRIIQGIGAGIYTPAITSFIQILFSGAARSKAFSIFGAIIGLSSALGPLIGGLLVQAGGETHGWRWVFMVNVPIGIILFPVAWKMLPHEAAARRSHNIDPIGLTLITTGLLALLVPLVEGQRLGWPVWTWISFGAAAVLLYCLWLWENRLDRRGREPLLATHLLKQVSFAAGSGLALIYFAAFTSIFFILSILWQEGLARSAMMTGFAIVPFAIGSMIAASQSDKFSRRMGRWVLVLGCSLVAVGLIGTYIAVHLGGATISAWTLTVPLFIAGTGNGLFIAPNQDFILASVPRKEAGIASGMVATAQRVGSALGIAAIGSAFFGSLHISPGPDALAKAFSHSAQVALIFNVVLILVALLLVFILPKNVNPQPDMATADI